MAAWIILKIIKSYIDLDTPIPVNITLQNPPNWNPCGFFSVNTVVYLPPKYRIFCLFEYYTSLATIVHNIDAV